MRRYCCATVVTLLAGVIGCSPAPPIEVRKPRADSAGSDQTSTPPSWAPQRLVRAHLPNALRLHANVISGGAPEGEEGFRELSELGVKTVISVDGAQPQVEMARQFGLRYVHLPHGYDGIGNARAHELAKAVRELPGPIYIHCHHGKHRSPAAATVACIGVGYLDPKFAEVVLQTAGTSANYRGLFDAAQHAQRFDDTELAALRVELPEVVQVAPLAEAMVIMEQLLDHLKAAQQADWRAPSAHPDMDPTHEALMLSEQFAELLRTQEVSAQPASFQQLMQNGHSAAESLAAGLRQWSDRQSPGPAVVVESMRSIAQNCLACHTQFRDVPLSEKARRDSRPSTGGD